LEETKSNSLKLKALDHMSLSGNDHNKNLLIDRNFVSLLIPFIKNGMLHSDQCFRNLCTTKSFEHKNKILNTPDFFPTMQSMLFFLLSVSNSLTNECINYFDYCSNVIFGLSMCCGDISPDNNADDDRVLVNVNADALQRCTSEQVPSLVLRILTELAPRILLTPSDRSFMVLLLSKFGQCLPLLFPNNTFKPDASTRTALCLAVELFLAGGVEVFRELELFVVESLMRVGGDCVVTCVSTPPNARILITSLQKKKHAFADPVVFINAIFRCLSIVKKLCVRGNLGGAGPCSGPARNVLLPVFAEDDAAGMRVLIEIEAVARAHLAEGKAREGTLKCCQKARDRACLCVCHLLRKCVGCEVWGVRM
jgi:hypothetical protein